MVTFRFNYDCIYVCVYSIRMRVYVYICICVYVYVCLFVYMRVCVCIVCVYVCLYVYVYICVYVCVHVYICIRMYVMYSCVAKQHTNTIHYLHGPGPSKVMLTVPILTEDNALKR
jgi:hypothetical protein